MYIGLTIRGGVMLRYSSMLVRKPNCAMNGGDLSEILSVSELNAILGIKHGFVVRMTKDIPSRTI